MIEEIYEIMFHTSFIVVNDVKYAKGLYFIID